MLQSHHKFEDDGETVLLAMGTADQNLVDQRIEQLGADKALRRGSITAQKLRSTAEDVLAEPAYRQASARLGKSFGQLNGYIHAADEIQAFKQIHGIS